MAAQPDAEAVAHRALAPVRTDDVASADRPLRSRLAIPDESGRSVLVLVERDQLRRVLEPRAELVGVPAEDRLEPDLGDEQPGRRAQGLVALVDVAEVVLELLAGQALDRDDRAVLLELEVGRLDDLRFEADASVDLDRPLVEHRRPRVDRRARVPLDGQRRDALRGQKERGRQPDQAAADDQDRNLVVRVSS